MEPASLTIEVPEGVYPPSDDTYLLIEHLELKEHQKVLEIGCGSGAIALNCAFAGCTTTAVDIDEAAIRCTLANAKANGLVIEAFQSDLLSNVKGSFDVIIFNPPYLRPIENSGYQKEDTDRRWDGGEGGSAVLKEFLIQAKDHLNPKGRCYVLYSSRGDIEDIDSFILKDWTILSKLTKSFFFEKLISVEIVSK